jgi:hypothetical protein
VLLRSDETHRQEHRFARQLEVRPLDLLEPPVHLLHLVRPQGAHVAGVVAEEALGVDGEHALAAFLVRGGCPHHQRPKRPGRGLGSLVRGPRHDLELVDRRRALPVRGAEAVGAGVTATDDHDSLAGRRDG